MYLRKAKIKKTGRVYLSIQQGYRDEKGKNKAKTIKSLGYVDELEKEFEDPIAHFTEEVARMNAEANQASAPVIVKMYPKKKIKKDTEGRIEMGAAVSSAYFNRVLGLWDFFEKKRTARNFTFDPCRILELLVWNRISNPGSKKAAFSARKRFPRKCRFKLDDIYRSLDYFALNSDELIKHMNKSIEKIRGPRDTTQLYYDVTNYYFEIDGEDEEDGLRKKGVNKEHRPEAIVQMGLLIDRCGIPLDYELFQGNVVDMATLLPVMSKAHLRQSAKENKRVVIVADKGLNTSANIAACILDGNGYVFSQSVRKATKKLKGWVLDERGYRANEDGSFKVKSRISEKAVYITGDDGKKRKVIVPVKEVAFWSRDYFERSRYERAKVIEKSQSAIERGDAASAVAKSSVRYTKDIPAIKETGEIADHNWVLDEDKIAADAAMDGYYCIVTSEQGWSEKEIIEAYRGLSRIEESFRVLKGDMDARPVYVWTNAHIRAHFLICYIALTVMRLIQADIESRTGNRPSAAKVKEALANLTGHRLDTNIYHFDYRTDLTDNLCDCVGIDLSKEIMTKGQMRDVMAKVKKPLDC